MSRRATTSQRPLNLWKFTFASYLTLYELLDEGLVCVGASLLVGRCKGHLLQADNGTREEAKDAQVLLKETKNLVAEDEIDERNPDHDIHIITKLFGRWVVFKVE